MGIFEQFPYTNLHELNLDWILEFIKSAGGTVENYEERVRALELAVQELRTTDAEMAALLEEALEQIRTMRTVPPGGAAGQVLTADGANGYTWTDAPKGGAVLGGRHVFGVLEGVTATVGYSEIVEEDT